MYQVFLVDDDELILEELVNTVPWPENGFEVVGSETDPLEAIERIRQCKPDVIFCDLKMPETDGNELIRRLKEIGITAELVMVSAYDNYGSVRAFFQQSGFDYILKPVNYDDISFVLERLARKLAEKNPPEKMDPPTDNPGFNQLLSYVGEHFTERMNLNELGSRFGFSKNYICGLFQKYYNKSLNLYLTDLRMEYARKLLEDKTILVKEVASMCGYTDYYHFFKIFKNHYGISPKELRGESEAE